MTRYTKSIVLDVNAVNKHQYIDAKQLDDKSRFLNVTLLANGEPVTIEAGTTAMFRAVKPDKHSVCYAAQINSDGTVTVELSQQALACKGVVEADVSLVGSDGEVLSTASFFLQVQGAPIGNDVASESEILIFQQLADAAAASAAQSSASVAAAEDAAETAVNAADDANTAAENAESATQEAVKAAEAATEVASEIAEAEQNYLKKKSTSVQTLDNSVALDGGTENRSWQVRRRFGDDIYEVFLMLDGAVGGASLVFYVNGKEVSKLSLNRTQVKSTVPVGIDSGGTGAQTKEAALENLGIVEKLAAKADAREAVQLVTYDDYKQSFTYTVKSAAVKLNIQTLGNLSELHVTQDGQTNLLYLSGGMEMSLPEDLAGKSWENSSFTPEWKAGLVLTVKCINDSFNDITASIALSDIAAAFLTEGEAEEG